LKERYDLRNIVGNSRPMQQVYEQVAQAAPTTTTVLIRGESGTGKELVAHAVHYGSPRAKKPFIKVSCGALPESLIESELFGYEPGAFTDARAQKKGRFELAHGGTLFLDEVGELSGSTQVKLLRVLQEREFERLGGVTPIKVNVRLVAATNKDLETAVKEGSFREDLYYRLNVFAVYLPPLRERRPDISLLADHFVEKYAAAHGKDVRRIATTAIDMLMSYHWPGNVRELENCIERAVLVCEGGVIHAHHLPPSLQTAEVSGTMPRKSLDEALASYEKDLIVDALKTARGNRAKAARLLDSTERIIGYAVQKYDIDCSRFPGLGPKPPLPHAGVSSRSGRSLSCGGSMTDEKPPSLPRRRVLEAASVAVAGLGLKALGLEPTAHASEAPAPKDRASSGMRFEPREKVRIGLVGCGGRGQSLLRDLLGIEKAVVKAICDVVPDRITGGGEPDRQERGDPPATFSKGDHDFENLCRRDDLDVVYIATPWTWHVPMAVCAMNGGLHAFVEVPAATTLEDCWKLVDTSERTRRHCVMLENCCYGYNELLVLNLTRAGVLGDLTHAEAAYPPRPPEAPLRRQRRGVVAESRAFRAQRQHLPHARARAGWRTTSTSTAATVSSGSSP
jgi:transcriptional regulator with AAA-type ATPase domain